MSTPCSDIRISLGLEPAVIGRLRHCRLPSAGPSSSNDAKFRPSNDLWIWSSANYTEIEELNQYDAVCHHICSPSLLGTRTASRPAGFLHLPQHKNICLAFLLAAPYPWANEWRWMIIELINSPFICNFEGFIFTNATRVSKAATTISGSLTMPGETAKELTRG